MWVSSPGGTVWRCKKIARFFAVAVCACATHVTVASAQGDCVQAWPPANAYVVGKEDWWPAGDIVQFVGDANKTLLGDTECSEFDDDWIDCHIDTAFNFRKVIDFQEDGCSYTEGDSCYVCKVKCCFWWDYQPVCGVCPCSCDPRYLCKTLWEVVGFSEDGSTGRGCYELGFVSDCPNEDCDGGLSMCTTTLNWTD